MSGRPSIPTGAIGNAWPDLLRQAAIPPASGTLVGNTVAANYNARLINPYTGKAFGPPPDGVFVRSTNSFYRNGAPLDTFAPRFGFAWQPLGAGGRLSVRGGYGLFYQTATYSGNAGGTPLFTSPPFAQGFTNADSSNNLSSLQKPFPTTTLGYVLRTPTSQLSDRVAGPDYLVPRLQQWNLSAQFRLRARAHLRYRLCRLAGQPAVAGPRPQPAAARHRRRARQLRLRWRGRALHHHQHRAERGLRVPIMGETPTALAANEFSGASAYHSLQVTLRRQAAHALSFQTTYTYSRAATNTSHLQRSQQSLAGLGALQLRPHPPLHRQFRLSVAGPPEGLDPGRHHHRAERTAHDPDRSQRRRRLRPRRDLHRHPLSRARPTPTWPLPGDTGSRLDRWIDTAAICAPAAIGSDGSTAYGTAGQSIMHGPGPVQYGFLARQDVPRGRPAGRRHAGLPHGVLQRPESPPIRQPRDGPRNRHLRRDHPEFGGPPPDSIRREIPVLMLVSLSPDR